jgi:hypothetical protein
MTRLVPAVLLLATLHAADLTGIPHPRLLFPESQEAAIRSRIGAEPLFGALHDSLLTEARGILERRTCRYDIPDGKRLLRESRLALHNINHTAMAWRLDGDPRFRRRVIAELDAACALKDWNPSHFLDTAEMALAVAIGYDWLFETLDPQQRTRYEDALIDKALRPAHAVYQKNRWWSRPGNNWSQVCGTGIALAAAAVAERDPELCGELFERGLKLIDGCTSFYEPDGAYPEGPSYWHYGTNYHVLLLAACQPLGVKPRVPQVLGRSGDFIMHLTGPMRVPFNFADAGAGRIVPTPAQSWLAGHFRDKTQAAALRASLAGIRERDGRIRGRRFFPYHLLWFPPASLAPADAADLPLADRFDGGQPVACFRSSWSPDAAYLAIKGGSAAVSHGQMDVGSFVYDAGEVRWFVDLGSDNYNMPGYFGGKRWDYFRLTNLSHNTLVIGGHKQKATRTPAGITATSQQGLESMVRFDLTPAYEGQASRVLREARFDHATGAVTLRDEVVQPQGDVRWAVFTRAEVAIDGPRAVLEQDGKRLVVARLAPLDCEWTLGDATPPTERENPNNGVRMLSFTAPGAAMLDLQVSWQPAQ